MTNGKTIFLLLMITYLMSVSCNRNTHYHYYITDFGARGDGKKLCSSAINRTIEACSSAGGGTVIVPAGTYITGTIILRSNINLHLEPGARLTGSRDTSDYLPMKSILFSEGYTRYGLIYAEEAMNISITGEGEIDGNGTSFMNGLDKPHLGGGDFDRQYIRQGEEFMKKGAVFEDGPVSYPFRPGMMITFERCERIRLNGVTLKDSPEWTVKMQDCDDAEISGISIFNNKLIPNSDGIHCTTSRNIRISGCNIFAGDDAVIVTGFGNGPTPEEISSGDLKIVTGNKTGYAENVTVTNCILSSRSAGIRVGYGKHPIRNLVFSNLVIYDSNRGIGVFARDNSSISNVTFSGITISNRLHSGHWWGKGEPIHVSAINDTEKGIAGKISNVSFSGIVADSETGILIYSSEKGLLKNLRFSEIDLSINRGKYTDSYGGNFDLRPAWPSSKRIFSHDITGIYACNVEGLDIDRVSLRWGQNLPAWCTSGIVVEDFSGLTLGYLDVTAAHINGTNHAIVLKNGDRLTWEGTSKPATIMTENVK